MHGSAARDRIPTETTDEIYAQVCDYVKSIQVRYFSEVHLAGKQKLYAFLSTIYIQQPNHRGTSLNIVRDSSKPKNCKEHLKLNSPVEVAESSRAIQPHEVVA